MPRRPSSKQLAKAHQRFKTALTAYVVSKGARPSQFYQYELDTPAGRLWISIYDDWIACRFDDVELGRQFSATCGRSCNRYSGKWNFHFFDGYAASLNPDSVIAFFGFYLDQTPSLVTAVPSDGRPKNRTEPNENHMNLLTLTDHKLSDFRQQVVQEIARRTKAIVENADSANIIHGNEMAKRALVVAVAGGHSILFVGPSNCGKTMMRAAALELDLTQTLEYRCCTCGNYSDPRADCRCTARQIEGHLRKMPVADITIQMQRPTHREIGYSGTALDDMQQQIAAMSDYVSTDLGPHETSLMKAVVVETAIDPAAQETVLSVARTIANLDNSERIEASHLMEAINYRPLATGV